MNMLKRSELVSKTITGLKILSTNNYKKYISKKAECLKKKKDHKAYKKICTEKDEILKYLSLILEILEKKKVKNYKNYKEELFPEKISEPKKKSIKTVKKYITPQQPYYLLTFRDNRPSPVYKKTRSNLYIVDFIYGAINAKGYNTSILGSLSKKRLTKNKNIVDYDIMTEFIYNFININRNDITDSIYTLITFELVNRLTNQITYMTKHLNQRLILKNDELHETDGFRYDTFEHFKEDLFKFFQPKDFYIDKSGSDNQLLYLNFINPYNFKISVAHVDKAHKYKFIGSIDNKQKIKKDYLYLNDIFNKNNYKVIDYHNNLIDDKSDIFLNTNKDCFISCLLYATKYHYKIITKLFKNIKGFSIKAIKKSGVKLDSNKLYAQIFRLLKYNVKIYQINNDKSNLFYETNTNFNNSFELLVYNDHFYNLIKDQPIIDDFKVSEKILFVYFDCETISDFRTMELIPTMISFYFNEYDISRNNDLKNFYNSDKTLSDEKNKIIDDIINNEKSQIDKLINDESVNCKNNVLVGKNCIRDFINKILEINKSYFKVICLGYNSAKFDNYLIAKEAFELNYFEMKLSTLFYDNHLFLNFAENIFFKDCMKYDNPGTLRSKTTFNKYYNKIQTGRYSFVEQNLIYNCSNLDTKEDRLNFYFEFMEKNGALQEFIEYCLYDTLSMVEWFTNLRLRYIIGGYYNEICNKYTLGGIALDIFQKKCKIPKFQMDNKFYEALIDSQYAGISYSRNFDKEDTDLVLLDIVSQYPASMIQKDNLFPTKFIDIIQNNYMFDIEEEYLDKDYVAIIKLINIDQSELRKHSINIIPFKDEKGYDYNSKELINSWVTSVDYKNLKKYGATFEWEKAYLFEGESGLSLFKNYVVSAAKTKILQDLAKDENSKEIFNKLNIKPIKYNKDIREFEKLKLNILTGKLSQKERLIKYKFLANIDNNQALNLIDDDYEIINHIGNSMVFKSEKKLEDVKKIQNYLPLAVFIYSYARQMIYDIIHEYKIHPLLIETDSILIKQDKWDEIKNNKREYYDCLTNKTKKVTLGFNNDYKLFGQWEPEFFADQAISLSKKSYILQNDKKTKYRYKGVRPDCKICDDPGIILIYNNINKIHDKESKDRIKLNLYTKISQQLTEDSDKSIFENYQLYKDLLNKKEILIYYNNISKNIKSSGITMRPVLGLKKL